MQAEENEEKRKQAAARLKAAYDTNVALLEKKRQAYYKRERANVERRKKQAEEREGLDERKKLMSLEKAEKRKVCACAGFVAIVETPILSPQKGGDTIALQTHG